MMQLIQTDGNRTSARTACISKYRSGLLSVSARPKKITHLGDGQNAITPPLTFTYEERKTLNLAIWTTFFGTRVNLEDIKEDSPDIQGYFKFLMQ